MEDILIQVELQQEDAVNKLRLLSTTLRQFALGFSSAFQTNVLTAFNAGFNQIPKHAKNVGLFADSISKLKKGLDSEALALQKTRQETEKQVGSTEKVNAAYIRRQAQINGLSRALDKLSQADEKGVRDANAHGKAISGLADKIRVANAQFTKQEQTLRTTSSALNENAASINNVATGFSKFVVLEKISAILQQVSSNIQSVGISAYESAKQWDTLNNKLQASTGSLEAAKAKTKELFDLAQNSPGVLTSDAIDLFSFLKPIQGIEESTINPLIQAIGKLKLTTESFDAKKFTLNLQQLVQNGFNSRDLKEAVTNFPRFGELIAQQFHLANSDRDSLKTGLLELQKQGKLTNDIWFKAVADAINQDANLSKLTDTIETRELKRAERRSLATKGLGDTIANVYGRISEVLTQVVEKIGNFFDNLPNPVKAFIVMLGGVITALAPIIAGIVTVIGGASLLVITFASVTAIAATVGEVLAVLAVAVGVVAAGVALLYEAWQNNWGNIRGFTEKVISDIIIFFENIQKWWKDNGDAIVGEILGFWNEIKVELNDLFYAIVDFAETAWENLKLGLKLVYQFWKDNNEEIKAVVSVAWNFIKDSIKAGLDFITGIIKIFGGIVQGDWRRVWDGFKNIYDAFYTDFKRSLAGLGQLLFDALKAMLREALGIKADAELTGTEIGKAFLNGIIVALDPIGAIVRSAIAKGFSLVENAKNQQFTNESKTDNITSADDLTNENAFVPRKPPPPPKQGSGGGKSGQSKSKQKKEIKESKIEVYEGDESKFINSDKLSAELQKILTVSQEFQDTVSQVTIDNKEIVTNFTDSDKLLIADLQSEYDSLFSKLATTHGKNAKQLRRKLKLIEEEIKNVGMGHLSGQSEISFGNVTLAGENSSVTNSNATQQSVTQTFTQSAAKLSFETISLTIKGYIDNLLQDLTGKEAELKEKQKQGFIDESELALALLNLEKDRLGIKLDELNKQGEINKLRVQADADLDTAKINKDKDKEISEANKRLQENLKINRAKAQADYNEAVSVIQKNAETKISEVKQKTDDEIKKLDLRNKQSLSDLNNEMKKADTEANIKFQEAFAKEEFGKSKADLEVSQSRLQILKDNLDLQNQLGQLTEKDYIAQKAVLEVHELQIQQRQYEIELEKIQKQLTQDLTVLEKEKLNAEISALNAKINKTRINQGLAKKERDAKLSDLDLKNDKERLDLQKSALQIEQEKINLQKTNKELNEVELTQKQKEIDLKEIDLIIEYKKLDVLKLQKELEFASPDDLPNIKARIKQTQDEIQNLLKKRETLGGKVKLSDFFERGDFSGLFDYASRQLDAFAQKLQQKAKDAAKAGQTWRGVFLSIGAGAVTMANVAVGALNRQLQAFIQTGKFSLTALRKQIADSLKAYARQWLVEGAVHLIKGFYYASNPFTAALAPREFAFGGGLLAQAGIAGVAGIALGAGTSSNASDGAAQGQAQSNANQNAGVTENFDARQPVVHKFEASLNLRVENIVKTDAGVVKKMLVEDVNRNGTIRNLFIGSGDPSASY